MENGESKSNTHIPSFIILIAIAAIAGVIYWHLWNDAPYVSHDSADYMEIAVDIREGGLDDLYYKTAGYPLLLALTDSANEPSRLLYFIQLSLHLISVLLIAFFLVRLQAQRLLVALFMILSLLPPSMVISAYVLTEALTEFFIVAGTVLLLLWLEKDSGGIKILLPIISGVAFGLSALIRPSYQLLFVALTGIMLLFLRFASAEKRRWTVAVLAVFIIPVLIIGGYCAYNNSKFGYAGLTPSLGLHLSTKTEGVIERLPDEYAEVREVLIRHRNNALVERSSEHTGKKVYIWHARPELEQMTGMDKPELSNYMLKLNLILIKRAPIQYMLDVASAATRFWFPSTTPHSNFHSRAMQLIWSLLHFIVISIFFLVAITMAGLGVMRWLLPRETRSKFFPRIKGSDILLPSLVIPFSVVIYTMLVSTMFDGGHQRYRTPTDLLILFLTVLGIHFLMSLRAAINRQR